MVFIYLVVWFRSNRPVSSWIGSHSSFPHKFHIHLCYSNSPPPSPKVIHNVKPWYSIFKKYVWTNQLTISNFSLDIHFDVEILKRMSVGAFNSSFGCNTIVVYICSFLMHSAFLPSLMHHSSLSSVWNMSQRCCLAGISD